MPVTVADTGTFNGTVTSLSPDPATATAAALNAAGAGNPVIRGVPWFYASGPSGSGATFTVPKDPGVVSGDVVLVFAAWNGGAPTPAITGFTACPKVTIPTLGCALFSRVADGTEGSSFTVSFTAAYNVAAVCVAYCNANGVLDPPPANSGVITQGLITIPGTGITTGAANDALIWFGAVRANGPGAPLPAMGVPSALQQEGGQAGTFTTVGSNVAVLAADGPGGLAGSTGDMPGTASLACNAGGVLLALQSSATLGTFASAVLAQASASALSAAAAGSVTVNPPRAAASASALDASVATAGAGLAVVVGATLNPAGPLYPGDTTYVQTANTFDGYVSTGLGTAITPGLIAQKWFFQSFTGTASADMTALAAAGCQFIVTYSDSSGTMTATKRSQLQTSVQALLNAGMTFVVVLGNESNVGSKFASAAVFSTWFNYYAPTVRALGVPCCYCPALTSSNDGTAYYPGDANCDGIIADLYCTGYTAGQRLAGVQALVDARTPQGLLGIGEWGPSGNGTTTPTTAQWNSFCTYLANLFTARVAAGKPSSYACYFGSAPGGNYIQVITSTTDFKIPGFQAVYAVSGV